MAVSEHRGEALHALESQLGRLEPGRWARCAAVTAALPGHAAVERSLPGALFVALEGAAGEGAARDRWRSWSGRRCSPSTRAHPADGAERCRTPPGRRTVGGADGNVARKTRPITS